MRAFVWLLGFVALLWALTALDQFTGLDLHRFGVVPRDTSSLLGIPLHIFVHDGFIHLLSNSGPLLVLGGLVGMRGAGTLLAVSIFIAVFAGAGVWLAGRDGVHIGASSLMFGYFGYLVARGFFERSFMSIPGSRGRGGLLRRTDLRAAAARRIRIVGGPPIRTHRRRHTGLGQRQGPA